jgi:hypothetical protein
VIRRIKQRLVAVGFAEQVAVLVMWQAAIVLIIIALVIANLILKAE